VDQALKVQLVLQAQTVDQVLKDLQDLTVHLVHKVLLDQMAHQDLKDLQAHPDHQVLKAQQVDLQPAQMLKLIH
jgi:hypothetical protein